VAANPFPGWLAEVAADAVVVRPEAIDAEASGNLWTFGLSPGQRAAVGPADVEKFVQAVLVARGQWLAERSAGPMRFYCWHDAQAGQFRFSLVSAAHDWLPFGCEVVQAASLAEVASDWLGSPRLHGIPWGELKSMAPDEESPEPPPLVLSVWSVVLSSDAEPSAGSDGG